jgi:hypothetical protein
MTHIVYTSIAARLDAGTYSPGIARALRAPIAAPSSPVASLAARVASLAAPYVGSALLGAVLALAYGVSP